LGDFADKPAQLREAWLKLVSQDAPLFIALDEIEKVNDGEVGKALLPVLLECIDGAQTKDGVFLVALSNAASALPPALMRRGRIDKVLHMDLPTPACREAYLRSILGDRYSADLPDKTQGMNYPDMLNLCLDILDEHGTKTT
jgi:SpoVK/Ycf46/Vps4 family AAA+-type ATPase